MKEYHEDTMTRQVRGSFPRPLEPFLAITDN